MSTRLEAFKRAYVNLDLLPLRSPKELANFRVDYGADVMAELEQLIEDDSTALGEQPQENTKQNLEVQGDG